jgi:prepilin-type N-terminal cleavage/methylation domain-containing protein
MSRRASTPCSGFTLVEILVALAILGVILAAFAQVISGSLLSARRIDSETDVLLFARSTMERLGRDLPLRPGRSHGTLAGGGGWDLSITPATITGRQAPTVARLASYLVVLTVVKPPFGPITLTSLRIGALAAAPS